MTGPRYVYAVCRPLDAPLQAQLTGVAGAPAKLLHHHGLVAVLSEVPERDFAEEPLRAHLMDDAWLAETARAHRGVVDALTAVTTPLPLRLATVLPDDSGVRSMIESGERTFLSTLDRIQGRVEWSVTASVAEDAPGDPWLEAERSATRLHETLSSFAEDSRLHEPHGGDPSGRAARTVLDASYLVPRGHSEEFVETLERVRADAPALRVELAGPWAAYSFARPATQEVWA
ncbi:GvpL/GvpF family gas vesicle protein [Streptomyces tropicalis]|uniref:GvpL/GvpF family gas vesicle protein n=1 Tax=Streptomyces tropicalis TaxID=3034234 RepID=A0ABT6A236_9ACTN|nr:GvpL/GvpF family gas vesicle protein [Streptomyces tropicalis]MDF3298711.1 GvpL/GvpF family gas vesicle protein [Streptomyces tropicalis]